MFMKSQEGFKVTFLKFFESLRVARKISEAVIFTIFCVGTNDLIFSVFKTNPAIM